jgi:hypothetical protein
MLYGTPPGPRAPTEPKRPEQATKPWRASESTGQSPHGASAWALRATLFRGFSVLLTLGERSTWSAPYIDRWLLLEGQ